MYGFWTLFHLRGRFFQNPSTKKRQELLQRRLGAVARASQSDGLALTRRIRAFCQRETCWYLEFLKVMKWNVTIMSQKNRETFSCCWKFVLVCWNLHPLLFGGEDDDVFSNSTTCAQIYSWWSPWHRQDSWESGSLENQGSYGIFKSFCRLGLPWFIGLATWSKWLWILTSPGLLAWICFRDRDFLWLPSSKRQWLAGKSPFLNGRYIFKPLFSHCHVSFLGGCSVSHHLIGWLFGILSDEFDLRSTKKSDFVEPTVELLNSKCELKNILYIYIYPHFYIWF